MSQHPSGLIEEENGEEKEELSLIIPSAVSEPR